LRVAAGWDEAVEAVLRERLNALPVDRAADFGALTVPPARISVYASDATAASSPTPSEDALAARVASDDPAARAILAEWLHGVRTAPDMATAIGGRDRLAPGECFVTPEGHIIGRYSITWFAPDAVVHGATTRQREIDALALELAKVEAQARAASDALAAAEKRYQDLRTLATQRRGAIVSVQRRVHALEVERMQIEQARSKADERTRQISAELAELDEQAQAEREQIEQLVAHLGEEEARRSEALAERETGRGVRNAADVALVKARETLRAAENALRDAMYAEKVARDRVAELSRRQAQNQRERAHAVAERERLSAESASILLAPIESALQQLLSTRGEREAALRAAREAVEQANARLVASEERRLAIEREFEPIRKRIEDARVRQSTAEGTIAQMDEQLAQLKVAPDRLAAKLAEAPRASALQSNLTRIESDIAALGAVNLAALEELEQARERKLYLDAQAADLAEAIATLEDAIRRIDRETRAQLSETYDQVNMHFGRLFPTLFGGGQAKLMLTGDEILDAGIQVVAQPPGKRNASIHLLSGGEKALTATALVFALFHLNPAPFCLLDEVDAPLDDPNTERFCKLVREMAMQTQFLFISHNKITMEMAEQLIGVTMSEPGVSRIVGVDVAQAIRMAKAA
ncbi:MAG: chromosome segregation protein SMC, partial [Casimicrobiaceae bacterium]